MPASLSLLPSIQLRSRRKTSQKSMLGSSWGKFLAASIFYPSTSYPSFLPLGFVILVPFRIQALTFIFSSFLTGQFLHKIGRPRAMILGALLIVTPNLLNLSIDRLHRGPRPLGLRGGQDRFHRLLLHLEVPVRGRRRHQLHFLIRHNRHSLQGGQREGYRNVGGKLGCWATSRAPDRIHPI